MLIEWIIKTLKFREYEKKADKEWEQRIVAEANRNLCAHVDHVRDMFNDYRKTVGVESRIEKMKDIFFALDNLKNELKKKG